MTFADRKKKLIPRYTLVRGVSLRELHTTTHGMCFAVNNAHTLVHVTWAGIDGTKLRLVLPKRNRKDRWKIQPDTVLELWVLNRMQLLTIN